MAEPVCPHCGGKLEKQQTSQTYRCTVCNASVTPLQRPTRTDARRMHRVDRRQQGPI